MVRNRFSIDAKTGKKTISEETIPEISVSPQNKGIDTEKLKLILKNKGIIINNSEVE